MGPDSFYGQLAALRGRLCRDEEFADFYCAHNGRPSKPPSLMATALLLQDVERADEGVRLKQGEDLDRIVSVHEPEMRHGRKSRSQRFYGHKASAAVDPQSQLILAVAVLPGNAPGSRGALALVEQSEENTGLQVSKLLADCAYEYGRTGAPSPSSTSRLTWKHSPAPVRPAK